MFEHIPPVMLHILYIIPTTFMALFHVINPIGSGILFTNLTVLADHKERRALAKNIAIKSFFVLVVVLIGGVFLMRLFGITIPVVQMCGGFMILAMGWKSLGDNNVVTDRDKQSAAGVAAPLQTDYSRQVFYPFTFPFTVGPGSIAITLTVSAETVTGATGYHLVEYGAAIVALLFVVASIYLCYTYSDYLLSKLSTELGQVIMKILSFVLLCIGGQIVVNGFTAFLQNLHATGVW